ncbi:MAG: hypothetical protein KJ749_04480, partial [Planctomycetes bacterium]|nr:hypothetical protein [Planctomycetota bacterium]
MVRRSVLQSLTRWLSRLGGRGLGIAFGGDSCRYAVSDHPDRLFQEPSLIVRCRSDGSIILNETSIGDVARDTLVCKNVDQYEYKQIFADDAAADEYVVSRMLRYFRRRAAERCSCSGPTRVVVTARPRLLQVIRPDFAR